MPVKVEDGAIWLYGIVGQLYWGDDYFTAAEVVGALSEIGRDVDVTAYINSGGGIATEGAAIHAILANHEGKVTTIVEGIAASAASTIFMAGETRIMRSGSTLMIHDPAEFTFGTVADHEKTIRSLNSIADAMVEIYSDTSGRDAKEIRSEMKHETWYSGASAIEAGYATDSDSKAAETAIAFDYSIYSNAPQALQSLASKNRWSFGQQPGVGQVAATTTHQPKGKVMSKQDTSNDAGATPNATEKNVDAAQITNTVKDRIKAIMTSEHAKGREQQAEHFAFNTEMSAEDAIKALSLAPAGRVEDGQAISKAEDTTDPTAYEQNRINSSGQAAPNAQHNSAEARKSVVDGALAKINKRR